MLCADSFALLGFDWKALKLVDEGSDRVIAIDRIACSSSEALRAIVVAPCTTHPCGASHANSPVLKSLSGSAGEEGRVGLSDCAPLRQGLYPRSQSSEVLSQMQTPAKQVHNAPRVSYKVERQ